MSKESAFALACPGCGYQIYWLQYHVRHCSNRNDSKIIRELKAKGFRGGD